MKAWVVLIVAVASTALAKPPRLVVLLVADQLGANTLEKHRALLGKQGVLKLFAEGARFTQARYPYASTYTCPGHACLSTGAYPHVNGVAGNRYYDRATGKVITTLADEAHPLLEVAPNPEDEVSPADLKVESLGDRLRAQTGGKVVAVALKDRAAVLLAGHGGAAYWFSEANGKMTTSTFYAEQLPAWVRAFNDRKLADAAFGKRWERALPAARYTGPDDAPYEADYKGLGRTFPHPLTGKLSAPGPDFYLAYVASPLALQLELAFVEAAIDAEGLGADEKTDLLAVSFSSTDYAGHAYGPDSHEVQDVLVHLDRAIAQLIAKLEKKLGKKNVVFAFSADHGVASAPERSAAAGLKAQRVKRSEVKQAVQKALSAAFGPAEDWVLAAEDPSLYLNAKLAAERGVSMEKAEQVALAGALSVPGIAAGFTRTQLLKDKGGDAPFARAMSLSFYPPRAGDVFLVPAEYCFWGAYGERTVGTTHGTPHAYDSHVPLVFYGAGVWPGLHEEPVEMGDVAPTLAALAGIKGLPQAEGKPLPILTPPP